jgi:sirohydrochlorin cobaltochelatase
VKALIIAAHGSRRIESGREVSSLVHRLSQKVTGSFDMVEHAFLQFAEPLLEQKIEETVQKGAAKIVIFPFFISSGSHILVDIPELVEKARSIHPGVEFIVTRPLGKIETIEEIIIREVTVQPGNYLDCK